MAALYWELWCLINSANHNKSYLREKLGTDKQTRPKWKEAGSLVILLVILLRKWKWEDQESRIILVYI